jgi:ABC-type cobalamin transport system permease subunit
MWSLALALVLAQAESENVAGDSGVVGVVGFVIVGVVATILVARSAKKRRR